jgi:hypothetical protein
MAPAYDYEQFHSARNNLIIYKFPDSADKSQPACLDQNASFNQRTEQFIHDGLIAK